MTQQKNAMPRVCNKCGETFDITYDFESINKDDFIEALEKITKTRNLCWQCRKY